MENETTIYSDIVPLQKTNINNYLLSPKLSNTETEMFWDSGNLQTLPLCENIYSYVGSYSDKWLSSNVPKNFDEKDFTPFTSTIFEPEIKLQSEKQMVNDHNVQPSKTVDVTNENPTTLSKFASVDKKLNCNSVNKLVFNEVEENTEFNDTAILREISISNFVNHAILENHLDKSVQDVSINKTIKNINSATVKSSLNKENCDKNVISLESLASFKRNENHTYRKIINNDYVDFVASKNNNYNHQSGCCDKENLFLIPEENKDKPITKDNSSNSLLDTTMNCISNENNASVKNRNVEKFNLNNNDNVVVSVLGNHLNDQKNNICFAQNLSFTEIGERLNDICTNDVKDTNNFDSLILNSVTNTDGNNVTAKLEKQISDKLFNNQYKQTFNDKDGRNTYFKKENTEQYFDKDTLFSSSSINTFNSNSHIIDKLNEPRSTDLKQSDDLKSEFEDDIYQVKESEKKRKADNMCMLPSLQSISTNTKEILQLPHINLEIGKRPRLSMDASHSIPDLYVHSYVPTINLDLISESNYNNVSHFSTENQNCTITSNESGDNINYYDNYNNEVLRQTGEIATEMLTNKQYKSGNMQDKLNMSCSNYIGNNEHVQNQKINNELSVVHKCNDTKSESRVCDQNLSRCSNSKPKQDCTVMDICDKLTYNDDKMNVIQCSITDVSEKGIDNTEKEITSTFINKLENNVSGESADKRIDTEFLDKMNKLENEDSIQLIDHNNQEVSNQITSVEVVLLNKKPLESIDSSKEDPSTNHLCDKTSQKSVDTKCHQGEQMQSADPKVTDFVEGGAALSNKTSPQIVDDLRLKANDSLNTSNSQLTKTDKSPSQNTAELIKDALKQQQPQQSKDGQIKSEVCPSIFSTKTPESSNQSAKKCIKSDTVSSTRTSQSFDNYTVKDIKTLGSSDCHPVECARLLSAETSKSTNYFAVKDAKSSRSSSTKSPEVKHMKSDPSSSTQALKASIHTVVKHNKLDASYSTKTPKPSNHSRGKHTKSKLSPSDKTSKSPNCSTAKEIKSDPSPSSKTLESTGCSTAKHTKSHSLSPAKASDSTKNSTVKNTNSYTKKSTTSVNRKPDSKSYSKKRPAETTAADNEPNKRPRSSKEANESKPGTSRSLSSSNYIDEREIADNKDPKWQLYNFSDPRDCFLAVYNQWYLTTPMYNPHEDLTRRYHEKKQYHNKTYYAIPGDKKRKDVDCISVYSEQLEEINNESANLKRDLDMYGSSWDRRRINHTIEKLRRLDDKHEQLVNAWDEAYRFYKHYKHPQTGYNAWCMSEYKRNEVKRQLDILECYEEFYGYT